MKKNANWRVICYYCYYPASIEFFALLDKRKFSVVFQNSCLNAENTQRTELSIPDGEPEEASSVSGGPGGRTPVSCV